MAGSVSAPMASSSTIRFLSVLQRASVDRKNVQYLYDSEEAFLFWQDVFHSLLVTGLYRQLEEELDPGMYCDMTQLQHGHMQP